MGIVFFKYIIIVDCATNCTDINWYKNAHEHPILFPIFRYHSERNI